MAVTVVTVANQIGSAVAGLPGTQVDISARVSSNVNCLVCFAQSEFTARSAVWDVCGGSPQTMVTIAEQNGEPGANEARIKGFYLMNPVAGEHILRAYISGTTANKLAGAFSLASVADTGSMRSPTLKFGKIAGADGTEFSANVVSTANEIVMDAVALGPGAADVSAGAELSAETGQTLAWRRFPNGSTTFIGAGSWQVGETSTRMSWNAAFGASASWSEFAVAAVATALPAAGGTPRFGALPLIGHR